ncbi:MAG: alpha/beta fold hydrolase [Streptosporangiales bacterium]
MITRDGTALHVEVDGTDDPRLTVIFVHGFALDVDCWHEQRAVPPGCEVRRVFYDHRGFGRSEPGPAGPVGVTQLAHDLADVITVTAPAGPVVLVGHSMGALTIQALGAVAPALFGTRVVAGVLMATPLRGDMVTLGLPRRVALALHRLVPGLLALSGRSRRTIPSRRVRVWAGRLAYGPHPVAEAWRRTGETIAANPVGLLAGCMVPVLAFAETGGLPALGKARIVVLAGSHDRLVPRQATLAVAEGTPGAEMITLGGSGHMVQCERPEQVNAILADVVSGALGVGRVARSPHSGEDPGPPPIR